MYENVILVTGGCGFIGSNFLNYMLEKYPKTLFVNIDKLDYCAREYSVGDRSNYKFMKGDLLDGYFVLSVLNQFNVKQVVHFAAYSHVDNSFNNSLDFTKNNVLGTHQLLEACRLYGKTNRFIHVSTDEVYGQILKGSCTENAIMNPTNPYSASKACCEMIVQSYIHSYKFPAIITRSNNIYGPYQYPEKLIPKFILHAINDIPFTVHGNGESIRDFLYVDDVVKAFELILEKGEIGTIYNIGSKERISVLELCDKLFEIFKREYYMRHPNWFVDDGVIRYIHQLPPNPFPELIQGKQGKERPYIEFVQDRPFNDFRYDIDSTRLNELGWKQTVSFEEGLQLTIDWYKRYQDYF